MMIRRLALIAVAVMLAIAPTLAQDKPVTLKMSSWVPPAHPLNPSLIAWAADIEKESGGSIKATLFPSEQLGKAFDHYDMARDGIADLAYVNPGYQPGRFPIIAAGELPFLIANAKGGSAAFDEWYRPFAAKEMKDTHDCFAFLLDPEAFHSRHKILLPEDIKGDKVRPGDATQGRFRETAGRHQRPGLGPRGAGGAGTGGRQLDHLPLGFDHAVRHRQGGEVPYGRADVHHDVRLGDEPGEIRARCRRRSARSSTIIAPVNGRKKSPPRLLSSSITGGLSWRPRPGTGLRADAGPDRGVAFGCAAVDGAMGGEGRERRQGAGRSEGGAASGTDAIVAE